MDQPNVTIPGEVGANAAAQAVPGANSPTAESSGKAPSPKVRINEVRERTPEVEAEIDDMFTYHPWDADQIERGGKVRAALAEAVKVICANVPPCPDRTVAIRKLREARMDANSAITSRGRY